MPGGVSAIDERFAFISQMLTPGIDRISLNELVQVGSGIGPLCINGRREHGPVRSLREFQK
jgi:hypothetical protein